MSTINIRGLEWRFRAAGESGGEWCADTKGHIRVVLDRRGYRLHTEWDVVDLSSGQQVGIGGGARYLGPGPTFALLKATAFMEERHGELFEYLGGEIPAAQGERGGRTG